LPCLSFFKFVYLFALAFCIVLLYKNVLYLMCSWLYSNL